MIDSRLVTLSTDHLALSATYLLEPASVAGFSRAFESLRASYPGLRLLLSGPWPPYSFVSTADDRPLLGAGTWNLSSVARAVVGKCTNSGD